MSDPSEYTPPAPETLPNDLRTDDEQDEMPPRDDDREEPVDDDFDELLSGSDDVDPDIAP